MSSCMKVLYRKPCGKVFGSKALKSVRSLCLIEVSLDQRLRSYRLPPTRKTKPKTHRLGSSVILHEPVAVSTVSDGSINQSEVVQTTMKPKDVAAKQVGVLFCMERKSIKSLLFTCGSIEW